MLGYQYTFHKIVANTVCNVTCLARFHIVEKFASSLDISCFNVNIIVEWARKRITKINTKKLSFYRMFLAISIIIKMSIFSCTQETFARARTRSKGLYARYLCSRAHSAYAAARPSACATIGYLVYNLKASPSARR